MRSAVARILPLLAITALVASWNAVASFLEVKSGFRLDNPPVPAGREFTVTGARFLRVGTDGVDLSMRVDRVEQKAGLAMRLEGVTARRPAAGGDTVLRAAIGTYDGSGGVLDLSGGVEVVTADGYRVRTEKARYESRAGRISGRAAVMVTGPSLRVRGGGFEFFPGRGILRLNGGVVCLTDTDSLGS